MSEWTYYHACYAPTGAKVSLLEPDQMVMVSYIDRPGSQYVCMGEYMEEKMFFNTAGVGHHAG